MYIVKYYYKVDEFLEALPHNLTSMRHFTSDAMIRQQVDNT